MKRLRRILLALMIIVPSDIAMGLAKVPPVLTGAMNVWAYYLVVPFPGRQRDQK